MGMLVISFFETTSSNLRKYDVVHSQTQRQDNWQVETRRRKSGKMAGSLYKVWTSPNGTKYYSQKKAMEAGFKDDGNDAPGNRGGGSNGKGGRKRQKKA